MNLSINRDYYVINEYLENQTFYELIDVDEIPDDMDTFNYKFINGEFVRCELIDKNYKPQEEINNEQLETNIDFDFRITSLELGL